MNLPPKVTELGGLEDDHDLGKMPNPMLAYCVVVLHNTY